MISLGNIDIKKVSVGSNEIKKISLGTTTIWQNGPYLAQDSDFVKVNGLWVYRGAELEVEIPTHINGQVVTSTERMFCGNATYKATPVTKVVLNHSNVTTMKSMFTSSSATTLDLSNFDTSNVTNMDYMFTSSSITIGYARTQADANKFNSTSSKPAGLNFVVKP